jgi:hypothetical protein
LQWFKQPVPGHTTYQKFLFRKIGDAVAVSAYELCRRRV